MAYDFTSGGDDAIRTALTAHNVLRSYGMWIWYDTKGENSEGRIFDKRDGGAFVEALGFFAGAPSGQITYRRVWSGAEARWHLDADPSSGAWHHILVTYDGGLTGNNPKFYIDGSLASNTEINTPSGTLNTNSDIYILGNRNSAGYNRGWDGRLGEWVVWNRLVTDDEAFLVGARKYAADFVPNGLIRYSPFIRELGDLRASGAQTLNDTPTVIEHPPIIRHTRPFLVLLPAAAAAAEIPAARPAWNYRLHG